MDILSILGIILSIGAIVGGQYLEGGHISSIVQGTAALIVLGGTVGAVMLQFPLPVFLKALASAGMVFGNVSVDCGRYTPMFPPGYESGSPATVHPGIGSNPPCCEV